MKQLIYSFPILFLVLLFACGENTGKANAQQNNVKYEAYHNDRYDYTVDYPDFLIPQGESDSKDGQKFFSEDQKIQMLVFYQFKDDVNAEGENLPIDKAYEEELSYKEGVISKKLEKDYYVIESKVGNIMFTDYVLFHDNYFDINFEYPESEKDRMKGVIEHVVKSFNVDMSGFNAMSQDGNASAGGSGDMFPAFLEGFLKDNYWGKNFNSLLRSKDKTLATYIDSKMDVRRYYAPGTIARLGTRDEDFGFAPEDDFVTSPRPTGDLIFEYVNDNGSPCDLIFSEIDSEIYVIYYEEIISVPDVVVDNETFETNPVKIAYHGAQIMAVYLPDAYNNPRGFYFFNTPDGWKLAFVDDSLCSA